MRAQQRVVRDLFGRKCLALLIMKFDCAILARMCSQWWSKDRCSSKYSPSSLQVRLPWSTFSLCILISGIILVLSLGNPISLSSYTTPLFCSITIFVPFGLNIMYFVLLVLIVILCRNLVHAILQRNINRGFYSFPFISLGNSLQ